MKPEPKSVVLATVLFKTKLPSGRPVSEQSLNANMHALSLWYQCSFVSKCIDLSPCFIKTYLERHHKTLLVWDGLPRVTPCGNSQAALIYGDQIKQRGPGVSVI